MKLEEDEDDDEVVVDRHMNVNVTSSGQGTRTVVLQIPKVTCFSLHFPLMFQ